MAQSDLAITLADLQNEVSKYLGSKRNYSSGTTDQQADVDASVKSGLRMFYFPPPIGESAPHVWSFLKNPETGFGDAGGSNMVAGTSSYDLPEDFSSMVGQVTLGDRTGIRHIPVIPEVKVRSLLANDPSDEASTPLNHRGVPQVCAVRAKHIAGSSDAGTASRWEIIFHPVPNDAYTPTYTYVRTPWSPRNPTDYPEGGMAHSDTILESCLAAAELRLEDAGAEGDRQIHQDRFKERLAASIVIDREVERNHSMSSWPVNTESNTLRLAYEDLMREIGGYLGKGWDHTAMSHEDYKMCQFILASGLREFYAESEWNFMQVIEEVVLKYDTPNLVGVSVYELPSDFSGITDNFTYPDLDGGGKLGRCSEQEIRALYAGDSTASGAPNYFCVRPRPSTGLHEQRWEVEFYPTPSSTENGKAMRYRYCKMPAKVDENNPNPLGNWAHSETILQSCLAVAETRFKNEETSQREKYAKMLENSKRIDGQSTEVDSRAFPVSGVSTSLYMEYEDYAREIGGYMGYGWNDAQWTHEYEQEIDHLVNAGLRQFYFPPQVDTRESHEWTFLEAVTSHFTWQQLAPTIAEDATRTISVVDVSGSTVTITASSAIFSSAHVNQLFIAGSEKCCHITSITSPTVAVCESTSGITAPEAGSAGELYSITKAGLYNRTYDSTTDLTTATLVNATTFDSTVTSPWLLRESMVNESITESTGDISGSFTIASVPTTTTCTISGDFTNALAAELVSAFTTRNPDGVYIMPANRNGIDGRLTYKTQTDLFESIPIISESQIREMRQSGTSVLTGRPRFAAMRPRAHDGTSTQLYELAFHPTPEQEWDLEYRYYQVPPRLSATVDIPHGLVEHQETILASMMACAELRKHEQKGVMWENFMSRLQASQSKDRRGRSPESWGYNGDSSIWQADNSSLRRWNRTHRVTVQGTLY